MLDIVTSLGGLIIPPLFKFINGKFLKKDTSTEGTISELATSNPALIPQFVEAQAKLLLAQRDFFNRDIVGEPSKWLVNLRGTIRPAAVAFGLIMIGVDYMVFKIGMDDGIRYFFEAIISSWFGSRLTQ